jgi:hypothetical protein
MTESKINEQDWDYVVLQGSAHRMAYPDYFTDHPLYPALVALRDKISANCAFTQMILGMPWAFEDGMTWYENWTDTYEDMQIKIFENTLDHARDIGFAVAPVGWAWYAVLKEKNYPLHYLHMRDWVHPTLKGSYLMASVIFSTVFLEPSTDIAYYGGLSEGEAKYFQSVASNTVFNNFNLWNIVDDVPPVMAMEKPREFLYIADRELIPLSSNTSVIFGKITITATAEDYQSGINRIELFVDDVLVQTITDGSFTMVYDDRVLGSYNLTMITYDNANNTANLQHPIWMFNI